MQYDNKLLIVMTKISNNKKYVTPNQGQYHRSQSQML